MKLGATTSTTKRTFGLRKRALKSGGKTWASLLHQLRNEIVENTYNIYLVDCGFFSQFELVLALLVVTNHPLRGVRSLQFIQVILAIMVNQQPVWHSKIGILNTTLCSCAHHRIHHQDFSSPILQVDLLHYHVSKIYTLRLSQEHPTTLPTVQCMVFLRCIANKKWYRIEIHL